MKWPTAAGQETSLEQTQARRIEELFKQNYTTLTVYAYGFVADWDKAAEVLQETFLDICRRPNRVLSKKDPLPWLKKACKLNCKELLRSERRYRNRNLSMDEALELADEPEYRFDEDICAEFGVTAEELKLLQRVYVHEIPRSRIAEELGISEAALHKRIARLKRKVGKNLKNLKIHVPKRGDSSSIEVGGECRVAQESK